VKPPAESIAKTAAAPAPAAHAPPNPEEVIRNISTGEWLNKALPRIFEAVWNFFNSSLGGFLGLFGFLLSLIIVPLYLFYFLAESPRIAASWTKYVPLRASEFKDEVVGYLIEVNGYLIAFFRGQLVVSTINGIATGTLLGLVGLDFGILIGLGLCFLGIIPYIGITLCWIPAVIIASVQGGSWLVPATAASWVFPVVVTGVFVVVQQVDGLFVTPRIVGERVGLHPVTVIFSVFLWSLLLGGLLGAILAVPLTAASKVLLKRYVWERTLVAPVAENPPTADPAGTS
jgi:predicted PurR-regulated permease PerM